MRLYFLIYRSTNQYIFQQILGFFQNSYKIVTVFPLHSERKMIQSKWKIFVNKEVKK